MVRKIFYFWFSVIFIWFIMGISQLFATGESVSLTTYYPSPSGSYNQINVTHKTTANQSMSLPATGSLQTSTSSATNPNNPVQTSISADGNIITPHVDFSSSTTTYARVLRAKDISTASIIGYTPSGAVDPTKWKIPTWTVQPWSGYTTWFDIWPKTINCQPGLLNTVQNNSGVIPVCLAIPISLPVCLVICTGAETFQMQYRCINPS